MNRRGNRAGARQARPSPLPLMSEYVRKRKEQHDA